MQRIFFSLFIGVIVLFSFFTNWYTPLIIAMMLILLAMILLKIGKGIVLLEIAAFLYVFTCLAMPLMGYKYFSAQNGLSRLWVKYMPISDEVYFKYALPAVSVFCLALTLPAFKKQLPDSGFQLEQRLKAIRNQLSEVSNKGLQIIIVGISFFIISPFLPGALNYFAVLLFFSAFAGLLYIYFAPVFRYKKIVMGLFILFILWNSLQSGMFTLVVYMGITIFSFFQVGKKTFILKKIFFLFLAFTFFIILQNVKGVYRKNTWKGNYEGNKVELFSDLFSSNLEKGVDLFSNNALFPIYGRTNQGFNVGLVMRRIPVKQSYDNGDRLLTVVASAFVPRFLWPDKPEAGGKFNMKYYTGLEIKGWSTNVGPLGEAYGSFGAVGGIIYMLLLALFLRWVYLRMIALSAKIPLLLCWIPVVFYDVTSSAETDTLQIINSIIKSAFFIWLLIKLVPQWFGIEKKKNMPRARIKQTIAA